MIAVLERTEVKEELGKNGKSGTVIVVDWPHEMRFILKNNRASVFFLKRLDNPDAEDKTLWPPDRIFVSALNIARERLAKYRRKRRY